MKIGIVTTWFERGAAYVSRQYLKILSNKHDVYVYARGGESYAVGDPNWDVPNVTWGKKCFNPISTSVDIKDFESWIKTYNIDIVFFNEQIWWEPVLLCKRLKILTGTYVDYYTEETVPFFGCYDFLICNTKRHQSAFDWHPQCHYIKWGTDIDVFHPLNLNLVNDNCLTFFHSGGVSPHRKGCDKVIKAFSKLNNSSRLVIHAQQNLKSFFPSLAKQISSLEDSGRLICIEKTVAAPGLYHLGDIYVYPTRLEGIGLTIMEANSCGLPVIVTGNSPMTEFIIDGVNGRHVKVDRYISRKDGYYWPQADVDIDDLTKQMSWYIDRLDEIPSFKMTARQYAEKNLDWKNNSKDILYAFENSRVLDESETQDIIARVSTYENRRYYTTKLSKYEHMKAVLQYKNPSIFNIASRALSLLRNQ
jgi:1,2-diacylglycerol 3-alpha-glucosyltransferase